MATVELKRRTARITYDDGRVQEVVAGKPIYAYKVEQLGLEDDFQKALVLAWIACGQPGHDSTLTRASAVKAMEAWLEGVADIGWDDEDVDGPPTKARKRS